MITARKFQWLSLFAFGLLVLGPSISAQTNPFLSPSGGERFLPKDSPAIQETYEETEIQVDRGIGRQILDWQIQLGRRMGDLVASIQDGTNVRLILLLLGITFLYGIMHTLGPGHRKTILTGWIIHSSPGVPGIIGAGVLLGLFHTLGTGIIVLVAAVLRDLFGGTLLQTRETVQVWVNLFSGGAVVALGGYLLFQTFGHTHSHDHSHEDNDSSLMTPVNLGDRKTLLMVALSMGLVPCPGSLSVLAVSFLLGDIWLGLWAVVFISLGTIFTLISLGLLVKFLVKRAEDLAQKGGRAGKILERLLQGIQLASAIVVLVYGALLTLGGILNL